MEQAKDVQGTHRHTSDPSGCCMTHIFLFPTLLRKP